MIITLLNLNILKNEMTFLRRVEYFLKFSPLTSAKNQIVTLTRDSTLNPKLRVNPEPRCPIPIPSH